MKMFRKDKDKDKEKEKDKLDNSSGGATKDNPSIRSRTSTSSPLLLQPGNSGPLGKDTSGSGTGSLRQTSLQSNDPKKQHAIRIGDTRFYGRIICRAKALYDYPLDGDTLQVEDEEIKLLKFKKGDIINVYEQDSSGWWAGEFNEDKGIFPGSYMKVLEEETASDPPPKQKSKSQHVSREELMRRISELEAERDAILKEYERDKVDFNKKLREVKIKADADVQEIKKTLAERDEVIQASTKKIRATEKDMEESAAKLAAKEVEVLTMELEIEEYKNKLPDLLAKQEVAREKKASEDKLQKEIAGNLKGIQAELSARTLEVQELNRQKQEIEKSMREAKAKLAAMEAQIIKKVMNSPSNDGHEQRASVDIDLLKKQLGEEVFEKRRMENEIREMKRMCVDVENLKTDKARLEVEVAGKLELENKLGKVDTILQGLINKDPSGMTVASMKELLSKVRKGIAATPNSSGSGSSGGGSGLNSPNTSNSLNTSGGVSPPPASPKQDRMSTRPKTMSFYKDTS